MTKIYGEGETEVRALDDVSFSVKKGEFILIVGSSGSGKSTLLNMIGLLDKPTKGRVIIDGQETTNLTDNQVSAFRNSKLGFVFQFANLLTDLTVLENVLLPGQIKQNTSLEKKAIELLDLPGCLADHRYTVETLDRMRFQIISLGILFGFLDFEKPIAFFLEFFLR